MPGPCRHRGVGPPPNLKLLLVTCRVLDYEEPRRRIPGLPIERRIPFANELQQAFIDRWYATLARLNRPLIGDPDDLRLRLRAAIATRADLRRLAGNPLLLTMMALLHASKGRLPEKRVELEVANGTIAQLTWRVIYSSGGGLIIAALVASLMLVLLRRSVVRPIKVLSDASTTLAAGHLDQTVRVTNNDEIGDLQEAFNQMAHNLREQQAILLQRNAEAEHARLVAEQANQLKSQFLANMSHELRTPLNAIINFTRFLDKDRYGTLTERQHDLQARVLANAEHLLGLINDVLDLSKIASGHIELFHEEIDLLPMLQGVMSTAVGLTKEKGLTLTLDVPKSLPTVKVDKTRIRQVLLNLLSNAAKFTEQGGITLRAAPAEDGMVCIAVQDTGIGIAPEHQELIFEEFRQMEGDLTRQYQGTGLGLPISRRLVELHSGRMWLESVPGDGSTFFFTLPAMQHSVNPHEPDLQPQYDAAHATVVVVDDDSNSQRILRDYLESAGYNVHAVLDSRHALATIRELQPQLVVLDVLMPHLDSWEVIAQIRSTPETSAIPVVMCSIVEQQQLGLALGANDYLVKPICEEQLVAVVKHWTSQPARILVIDDDADARHVIQSILSEEGCQVVEAVNGVQGLAVVGETKPDLVLLDLMMPELDGFEVLDQLRTNPEYAALPVIVVTAKDLSQDERQWLLSRSQACIQKGQLSTKEFLDYIQMIVRKESRYAHRT